MHRHYLHLPFTLYTTEGDRGVSTANSPLGGVNHFARGDYSRDLRHARITLRLRGVGYEGRGAALKLLVQGAVGGMEAGQTLNFVYEKEVFDVPAGPDWEERTVTVDPDPAGWTYLSSRPDLAERYIGGERLQDITELLADVNLDIIFVLHNLDVAPRPGSGAASAADIHALWPRNGDLPEDAPGGGPSMAYEGEAVPFDYEADPARLPSGAIEIAQVAIAYAAPARM